MFTVCCFRSLGVHVSKVRSLILDAWEPEQVKVRLGIVKLILQQPDRMLERGVQGEGVISDRPVLSFLGRIHYTLIFILC